MKLDRLMGIVTILLQKKRVTAPWLARRFEVSRRTISRDIDALCRAGIPIITYPGSGGGICISEGYKLEKSVLTAEELGTLVAAVRGVGSVSNTGSMLEKLGADAVVSLKENIVIDLASHYKGSLTDKIDGIKQAVSECRLVEFDYFYEKGESHRQVEPYYVIFQWTAWYLFGFCLQRQDWRLFKLTRLWNLTLSGGTFLPRQIPPEQQSMDRPFTDAHRLTALFHPAAKYLLIDHYGPDCYTVEADGRLRLELEYTNRRYIIGWLLSFGENAVVVQPEDLAAEMGEITRKMAAQY